MTLCKNCGTVYDEFYGVCPRCGTPCQNATDTAASPLPPLGGISPAPGNTPVQSPLPPIDIAIRNTARPVVYRNDLRSPGKGYRDLKGRRYSKQIRYRVLF